ncbi:uncharacterized protein LOC135371011 [Ornithodoros turicata]|uniref:uncharacterized protein LOC135371011 n=1 Tax=Ornithodoros turicata TaxID=34597 RepID=UPI00313A27C0
MSRHLAFLPQGSIRLNRMNEAKRFVFKACDRMAGGKTYRPGRRLCAESLSICTAIVCAIGFLYQMSSIMSVYFQYNFSVTMEERYRSSIVFPAVTVCVDGWMDRETLCRLRPGKCTKNDLVLAPGLYIVQTDSNLRRSVTFEPQALLSCQLTFGDSNCPPENCTDGFATTYYRQPSQQCYTVDINRWLGENHTAHQCSRQSKWELEVRYSWDPKKTLLLLPMWVYPLVVHATGMCPPDKLASVMLQPGKIMEVTVKQLRTHRLPAPYKSMCTNYRVMGTFHEFRGYLNLDLCIQKCSMELEVKHCGCILTTYEFTALYPAPTCEFTIADHCKSSLTKNGTYLWCKKICGLPCEQLHYDVRVASISDEKGTRQEIRSKFTLKLKYRSETEELVLYHPSLTVNELLAYIGAYFGIWLGMSVASLVLNLEKWVRRHKTTVEDIMMWLERRHHRFMMNRIKRWPMHRIIIQ